MTDVTLVLGDLTFAGFEVPETINFGGDQKVIVHELVGGARVIDAMGETPATVEWSGWLTGGEAVSRALALDAVRKAGAAVPLTWDQIVYSVVVKTLHLDYRSPYRIPYRISCEPVADTTSSATAAVGPDVDQQVGDDATTAAAMAGTIGDPPLVGLLGSVQSALADAGPLVAATRSAVNTVLQPLAGARTRVGVLMGAANAAIGAFDGTAAKLAGQTAGIASSANLLALDAMLGRMQANIGSAGAATRTVTVAGGTLFGIAATEYGDPMAWTALAAANGLTDPSLSGIVTLAVPASPAMPDGILNG